MKLTCPHCSQVASIADIADADSPCPACGGAFPIPMKGRETLVHAALRTYRGLNRNLRILGAVTLLLLGGLAVFIASRYWGDTFRKRQTVLNRTINNEYFTKLIASGATSAKELEAVENVLAYGSGFIGVSKDKLSWLQARELADRTGAEVLDLAVTASQSRRELTGWLAASYPPQHGATVWVRDNQATKVIDCPDVLTVTALEHPRRVFLHWPKTESWVNRGWSWTIQPQFDEVTASSEWRLARVRAGKLWGVIDETSAVVQPPSFDQIEPFVEQGSARVLQGGKWGLLDRTGKLVAKSEWEDVQHFINGFIPVKKDGRWGYLDATGALAIRCEWDDAWRFSPEGFAVVTRNGKRGFIDRTGKVIVEPMWDGAVNFAKEGIGMVRKGEAWALIDTTGQLLCEPKWSGKWNNRRFDLGFLPVRSGPTWYLLGLDGKSLPGTMCEGVLESQAGAKIRRTLGDWAILGAAGETLFTTSGSISDYSEGLAMVTSHEGFGFIDAKGKWILPPRSGMLRPFVNGYAACEAGGKWGFIDRTGKVVVKQEWDEVADFHEGHAAVKRSDKWGFVDGTGNIVAAPAWKAVGPYSDGLAGVLIDQPAEKPKYDSVRRQFVNVKRPTWSFINRTGEPAFGNRSWPIVGMVPKFEHGFAQALDQPAGAKWPTGLLLIDSNGRETRMPWGQTRKSYPAGLALNRALRPGNYLNRHGDAGYGSMLTGPQGDIVMPEAHSNAELMGDFIPYATPPKFGLIDATGKILAQPVWDEARILSSDWVWIRVGGKCGLADGTGKVVIAPAWDELDVLPVNSGSLGNDGKSILIGSVGARFLSPWVRVKEGDKTKILHTNGQSAIPDKFAVAEYVDFYGPTHVVFKQPDGQGGFVWSMYEPATGDQVKFTEASTFRWNWNMASKGVIWMKDKATAEWRLLSRKGYDFGHRQPEAEKPDGWGFVEGRGLLHKPDGWVFVDTAIKPILPDKWEKARDFSEGRAAVSKEGKWGFIGLDGRTLIAPVWDQVLDFSRGRAAFQKEGRWGYVDPEGKVVIEPVWDEAQSFRKWLGESAADNAEVSMDVAEVKINAAAAFIDRSGRLVVDPSQPRIVRRGAAAVNGKDELIVVRPQASEVVIRRTWNENERETLEATPARAWMRTVPDASGQKFDWTLVDETGKALTKAGWGEPWYDRKADPLAGGLLSVRTKDQKYGLIRRDGTVAVEPRFDRIAWIAPKVAAVWTRDAGGLIDAAGNWLFKDNDKVRVARFGLRDRRATEPQHQHGLALIEDVPKWGYARLNRKDTKPPQP